jgi:flagellar assembly protein FliH
MSSKVLRGDAEMKPAPAWRPASRVNGTMVAAPPVTQAPDPQREIDARLKAAYQQGFTAAETAAAQRASQQIEPVISAFNALIQDLAGTRVKFRADSERDTVKLAIAIARRVLHRELATDPEAILGLVMAAFQKMNARETHRLRVSPQDAGLLKEHRARLQMPEGLELMADSSLSTGSAVFETSRGELDASVDTQLAEIDRGFADILRRRG